MSTNTVSLETMIPDVLARHPQARAVFDRYGLSGCGGARGPVESVGFFARTHGVGEAQLLRELELAAAGASFVPQTQASVADTIYRRFFTAGILVVLTAGATWGAWLLWNIGFRGAFTAVSLFQVNAHGHAQIFGWVGLFIMGFAYQAFPRMWHQPLAAPRLAVAAFVAMLIGLVLRVVSMTLAGHWSAAVPVTIVGGLLETGAAITFAGQLAVTYARSDKPFEPYLGFAFGAAGWFVVMTVFSLWHAWVTMAATSREALLWYVATYQAPLRDVQIHGLALFMILGVSLRLLPAMFGLPQVPARRAWAGLGVLTVAVLAECGLFVAYRWTGQHAWAAAMWGSWVLLALGVVLVAGGWRFWRPMPDTEAAADRSAKFVRAAYGWLAISLLMLLLFPAYQAVSGRPFSHANYGAIRHAITVGFISLMIMGLAAKVVPTLNGADPANLSRLWGPFLLVNLGCFLRVSFQTLTDWHSLFFSLVGISGTLEVAGLAWWGVGLLRIIRQGRRESREFNQPRTGHPQLVQLGVLNSRPSRIEPGHKVADVLEWFPETQAVFAANGFGAVQQPLLRRTLARTVSLDQACRMHGVDVAGFVDALNAARGEGAVRSEM